MGHQTIQIASTFRQPPHNIEAEKAVLGAIFANNRAYEAVSEFLKSEHFALGQNGQIFEACGKIIDGGGVADPVTLKHRLGQGLDDVGGQAYLADLASCAVGLVNATEYANLVVDLAKRRRIIEIADEAAAEAFDSPDTAEAIQERAEGRLFDLADKGTRTGAQPLSAYVDQSLRQAEASYKSGKPAGLPTGLVDLDEKLGGLHPTDLIILAGRPGIGKSALATTIGFNIARLARNLQLTPAVPQIAPIKVFSLEMSGEQLTMREMAGRAGFSSHLVRQGRIGQDQFQALMRSGEDMRTLPLWIDERPALPIRYMYTSARRFKRQHGLSLVIIDYLQLATDDDGKKNGRVQEISAITAGLKAMAKDLKVPVLALSQLSRAVEQRDNKRPQLADLRDGGTIEQDADVVMFLYREEYYLERDKPEQRLDESDDRFFDRVAKWEAHLAKAKSLAEIIVAKQRHGPIGTVNARFDGAAARFDNLGAM
jgi:replicative DNA helicase